MTGVFDELLEQQRQRYADGAPAPLEEPPPRTDGWTLTEQAINWNYLYSQALTELQSQDPSFASHFATLSADAKEELKLAVLDPVENALSPDGSFDIEAVRTAFEGASFVANVEGTTFSAWRDGELLIRLEHIDTAAENATASNAQTVSIVLEAIFFFIAVFLVVPTPTETAFGRVIQAISRDVAESPSFQQAIDALPEAYQEGAWEFAKAIAAVVFKSNAHGLVLQVVHIVMAGMTWYQKMLCALQILALIAAAGLSGGAAVVAKIAVIVMQATEFIVKVRNLQAIQALAPATA